MKKNFFGYAARAFADGVEIPEPKNPDVGTFVLLRWEKRLNDKPKAIIYDPDEIYSGYKLAIRIHFESKDLPGAFRVGGVYEPPR